MKLPKLYGASPEFLLSASTPVAKLLGRTSEFFSPFLPGSHFFCAVFSTVKYCVKLIEATAYL